MIDGRLFIGASRVETETSFHAIDAASGTSLEPPFSCAGGAEVERACTLADEAFPCFSAISAEARALFLERIADNILALGDGLLDRAALETGLPLARLAGERVRTVSQLRLFAAELRDGGWMGIRIDPAQPERAPIPRSDLRMRKVALGPVAIFGASNFPLAFSVAGGDTASALAAGCPVIVKGHPAHPGTSELVAGAIADAVADRDLPEGVFSLLNGTSHDLGGALVSDPRIKAVGFTGSRAGGIALMKLAAARAEPIPVYAEMSATNPVVLLPGALEDRAEAIASGYVASLTMGAGQFCTNPGLVLAIDTPALRTFVEAATRAVAQAPAAVMLTPAIHSAYEQGVAALAAAPQVEMLARGVAPTGPHQCEAALFCLPADAFDPHGEVAKEVFGASSVLVRCRDEAALLKVIGELEGQLTATVHFNAADEPRVALILPALERKAGRLIANGWPTGVEVSHAMVHGGPFPATSDGRSTSVGTLAIDRFLRPVCYQDFPDHLQPAPLRAASLAAVPHRFDGRAIAGD